MDSLVRSLSAAIDPVSLMERIAEQLRVFSPHADGAGVTVCTPEGQLVVVSACGIAAPLLGRVMPAEGSFHDHTVTSGQARRIDDIGVCAELPLATQSLLGALGVQSWVLVPLLHRGSAIGALSVVSTRLAAFADVDVAALAATSRFISALIGAHAEMSVLLDELLRDPAADTDRTAHLVASMLIPHDARDHDLLDRLEQMLSPQQRLRAVFQPIVNFASGETVSVEALCRFPKGSGLDPQQWFETAQKFGYGPELELKALTTALDAATALPPGYAVGVNLSPLVALEGPAHDILIAQPRPLIVEITEHAPFPTRLGESLQPLRRNGIRVAVDDAGAGFASFTQLIRVAPDIIKIDGELTLGVDGNPAKRALVSAIVGLAAELGACTVAEAVETTTQAQALIELGVVYGQGLLLGGARSADQFR